ncbi:MAG: FoF1 ATP synthase subunit gamma [Clostridium fessum]
MQNVIRRIQRHLPNMESPYFEKEGHQSKKTGLLVISGDKGLAGAYNHNIMKMADTFLKDPSREVHLFVIGETGRQFFASQHIPIEENFQYTAQDPTFNRARWIAGMLLERYLSGDLDEIHVLYTRMENVMQSVAKDKRSASDYQAGYAWNGDSGRCAAGGVFPPANAGGSDECDRSELCSRIYLRRAG